MQRHETRKLHWSGPAQRQTRLFPPGSFRCGFSRTFTLSMMQTSSTERSRGVDADVQYRELQACLPAARNKATLLGVLNNLRTFGATVPPYMPSVMVGPAVVPSYVGWYFTVIRLGHALLPVYCAYRQGDEGAPLLPGLGIRPIRGFPFRGEVSPGEERPAQDLRMRQLPAPAAQLGTP
jgi:hypothetical protein